MPHTWDDSHNCILNSRLVCLRGLLIKLLANWVAAWKEFLGKVLIDQDNQRVTQNIVRSKASPAQNRNSHGPEIVW